MGLVPAKPVGFAMWPNFDPQSAIKHLVHNMFARVTAPLVRVRVRLEGVDMAATLDWSQCPAVESVPGKVSGAWVLKGTRMPVSAIFENLEAGANIDDIMDWFDGLDREQVKAVIDFAVRSLDKEPAYAP